ncbi:hypothetical protein QE152_g27089 [Popillia japonica]|uniref:Uncharacterized protein n=1 Tax=Popillia japonica TaxID=7064 RepID=A0AAW1JXB4_POPJA
MTSANNRSCYAISPNIESELFKLFVRKGDIHTRNWPQKWDWLLKEYAGLRDKTRKITERSILIPQKSATDPRRIAIPSSTNGYYGWLCTRPEFQLEKYGPDVKDYTIPEEYRSN